jgi:hypothetical protein
MGGFLDLKLERDKLCRLGRELRWREAFCCWTSSCNAAGLHRAVLFQLVHRPAELPGYLVCTRPWV